MYATTIGTADTPVVRNWGHEDVAVQFGPFATVITSVADADALVIAAAEAKKALLARRPAGKSYTCACGHLEAYHVGAVLGDKNPGQCTDGDDGAPVGTCDCQRYSAAVLTAVSQ